MKEYEQKICNIINNAKEDVIFQAHQAYQNGYIYGYENGKAETLFTDTEEAEKKAYNRGLNDAWKLVKRIESTPEDGGLTNKQIVEVFGQYWSSFELYRAFSVEEAMDLMKAYEDKQDTEIKVGDEVTYNGAKFIVLNIDSQTSVYCLDIRGRTPIFASIRNLTKTGRHFDQIAEVLAELRGAEQ